MKNGYFRKLTGWAGLAVLTAALLSGCTSQETAAIQEIGEEVASELADEISDEVMGDHDNGEESVETKEVTAADDTQTETAPAWKEAYREILQKERERAVELAVGAEKESEDEEAVDPEVESIDCYWLNDIDKDGTPELLIRYGHYEAAYHGSCYTMKDGKAVLVSDDIGLGHSTFEAAPKENGIVLYMGHMGYGDCWILRLQDGKLVEEHLFEDNLNERLEQDENAWYKPASDVVEGAFYLEPFRANTDLPILLYEEIGKEESGSAEDAGKKAEFPNDDPEFFEKIMERNEQVIAVAMDQFMISSGKTDFNTLLEPNTIYEYSDEGMRINSYECADLNRDGKLECIVYLDDRNAEENSNGQRKGEYRVILSEQDGRVYAYLTFVPPESSISEDGTLILTEDWDSGYGLRVLFEGDESFQYSVPPVK